VSANPVIDGQMDQHDRVIPLCRKESCLCRAALCLQVPSTVEHCFREVLVEAGGDADA